jgi:hypothetical protein
VTVIDPADLVGLAEIAIRAGCTNAAVANWAARHPGFPAPVRELICGPVYSWAAVADWLNRHDKPGARSKGVITDAKALAILKDLRRDDLPTWAMVGALHGVSARTVQHIAQAQAIGEDYGWYTRQRRERAT